MSKIVTIDAGRMHFSVLNREIRAAVGNGADEIVLEHVLGQRFIADGLIGDVKIIVNGVPGGDLGIFMNGPTVVVHGNCDHAPGNTMDRGTIAVHGSAGDATGHSMRGGSIYIRDDIGYRGGIHMKEYGEKKPILVVGGSTGAFLGEYMAGGTIVVLGINREKPLCGRGIGSGIHGGRIFIRGGVDESQLGLGALSRHATEDERRDIEPIITNFGDFFGIIVDETLASEFTCVTPASTRPFAGKYTWE